MPVPHSRAARRGSIAAVVLILVAVLSDPLGAQRSDASWMDDCDRLSRGERERFCETRPSTMAAPTGTLRIEPGRNGGVSVEGYEGSRIEISARIQTQAYSLSEARQLAERIVVSGSGNSITVDGPGTADGANWSVSFVVRVPRGQDISVETYNGGIAVRDVSSTMELRTYNGPLSLTSVSGNVRGRTHNGPLRVTLHGSQWSGAGLDLETHNGPVQLGIPDGYSARLETGTRNGGMQIGFPITVQGRIGRSISTDLGRGGAPIRVMTSNGPVRIERN